MCRLLGITNFEFSKHQQIVLNFCELARSGMVMKGDPPGHADGWGVAFYQNGELEVYKSGGNLLEETDQALELLSKTRECPVVILHLRKSAWKNTTSPRHAHPFRYGNVAFAHNGTVYDYKELIPDITPSVLRKDALDTEVFFHHFMRNPSPELGKAFLHTVSLIKSLCRYSALNCLFSDGLKLFAYRDYSREPAYYSLFKAFSGNSCFISSQTLDKITCWELMKKEEFLVV